MNKTNPRLGPDRSQEAFSLIELIAFLICAAIVLSLALWLVNAGKRSACEITAKHDLRKFVEAEQAYRAENDTYKGNQGDCIANVPDQPSTFGMEGFQPSEGVFVTITSVEPFIVFAKHRNAPLGFEHNFETGLIRKRMERQ
jgi:type II secretory pathway pseudopilin PulG